MTAAKSVGANFDILSSTFFDSLSSYWKFDNSSGSVVDSTGNLSGNVINSLTRGVVGKLNNAFNFTNGCVDVPSESIHNNFSVSLWLNKSSTENSYERIFVFGQFGIEMAINNSTLYYYPSNEWHSTGISLSSDTWYHIVFTHSDTNINKVYVNGVLRDTYTHEILSYDTSSQSDMTIGCSYGWYNFGYDNKFIGVIDEVSVWDKVLTSNDASTLYNSGNGMSYIPLTHNLTSYWKFDNSSGSVVDSTSNLSANVVNSLTRGVAGKINTAFNFTNGCVEIPNEYISSNFSVSLWLNKSSSENSYERIFGFHNWGLEMAINNSTLYYYPEKIWRNTGFSLSSDTWYHIVFTHSDTNINKVYVNGVLVDTYTRKLDEFFDMFVGCSYKKTDNFIGIIDEVGVWDKVLTSSDVSTLYNLGNALNYNESTNNFEKHFNLTSYWKFDNSSGSVVDSTSNYSGNVVNSLTRGVTGKINNAFNFTNGCVQIPDEYASSDFSVSLWLNKSSTENSYERIFGFSHFQLEMAIQNSVLYYYPSNVWHSTGVSLSNNTWYHIVFTHSSGNINKVYINGVLSDTYTHGVSLKADLTIGCSYLDRDNFIGVIDEISVWHKVLTSSDVSALYNSGNALSYPFN